MSFDFRNQLTKEAYTYFNKKIRPIEFTFNKQKKIWTVKEGSHNNDIDAFRHAYISGCLTQKFRPIGEFVANILGQLNEIAGDIINNQSAAEKNMDLWNNKIGREYGKKINSKKELADALANALKKGELIITIDPIIDSRKYEDEDINVSIDHNKPMIVLQQSKTGRNELFLDLANKVMMDREKFINQIQTGLYSGYKVVTIQNLPTPVSKPDSSLKNNLD